VGIFSFFVVVVVVRRFSKEEDDARLSVVGSVDEISI